MKAIAKVFMHGNSQAVRLPKKFRFDVDEVRVRKNELTGELILSPAPSETAIQAFLRGWEALPTDPVDFVRPRSPMPGRDLFESWEDEEAP